MQGEKEIGCKVTKEEIPQIEKILETKLDEEGIRLYKIAWKTSWLAEASLQKYREQVENFWTDHKELEEMKISDEVCTTSKQTQNYLPEENTVKRRGQTENQNHCLNTCKETEHEIVHANSEEEILQNINQREIINTESEEDLVVGVDCSSESENPTMHCKRKTNWNLEDIVLKLKKSRKSDDLSSTGSMSPHRNETSDFEDVDDYENLSSPVYPRYPSYVDEKFFSQKSSFLTQLEQKDDLEYFNSVKIEKTTTSTASDTDNDSVSSNDGDNNSGDNISEINKSGDNKYYRDNGGNGDEQLNQLLEEEVKLGGDDKIPETRCKKCNKKFYRRTQLIRHLSNHVMHECLHCKAIYYCVKKYKKHMSTHETYPCEFCNQEFYDASAWYQHRAKHTMVECNSCDMIFYNKTALTKHKFEHLEYICPLCHLSLENLHYWIAHKNQHARENSLRAVRGFLSPIMACRICHISFITQDVFLKHKCHGKHNKKLSVKPAPALTDRQPAAYREREHLPITKDRRQPLFRGGEHLQISKVRSPTFRVREHLSSPKELNLAFGIREHLPVPKERQHGFRMREIRGLVNRQPYHHRHHYRPDRVMNKKDINEMIGVDHTLACSS